MKAVYNLPEKDRERIRRREMIGVEMLVCINTYLKVVEQQLGDRLDCIPSGKKRIALMRGQGKKLFLDLMGTITKEQRAHIDSIGTDMEIRLVPKLSPIKTTLVLSKDEARELVDAAQEKCLDCVMTQEESRSCKLCKLLETLVPLDDYDGMNCPYGNARKQWRDED